MKRLLFFLFTPALMLLGLTGCPVDESDEVVPSDSTEVCGNGFGWYSYKSGIIDMAEVPSGAQLSASGLANVHSWMCSESLYGDFIVEMSVSGIDLGVGSPGFPCELVAALTINEDQIVAVTDVDDISVRGELKRGTGGGYYDAQVRCRFTEGKPDHVGWGITDQDVVLLGNHHPGTWTGRIERIGDTLYATSVMDGNIASIKRFFGPQSLKLRLGVSLRGYSSPNVSRAVVENVFVQDSRGIGSFIPFEGGIDWFNSLPTE